LLNLTENPRIRLNSLSNWSAEEASEYYKLVLDILCVTSFMTSSITVKDAVIWVKYVYNDKVT